MTQNAPPGWPQLGFQIIISLWFTGLLNPKISIALNPSGTMSNVNFKNMRYHRKECMNSERVTKEWDEILSEVCQRLIENISKRIAAVIKANGGHIKY